MNSTVSTGFTTNVQIFPERCFSLKSNMVIQPKHTRARQPEKTHCLP